MYEKSESVGSLIEKRSQETLFDIVNKKKRIWLRSPVPYFFSGYIASDTDTFNRVTEYLSHEFEISQNCIYQLSIPQNATNYLDLLMDRKSGFSQATGDILIVKVKDFAKVKKLLSISHRTAHDFDQDLERFLPNVHEKYGFVEENPYNWGVNKRIIIASHIDIEDNMNLRRSKTRRYLALGS